MAYIEGAGGSRGRFYENYETKALKDSQSQF